MEAFFSLITSLFGKVDNVAILVLIAVCTALLYLHVVWRKEEREDRRQFLEACKDMTEALNSLKQVLTLLIGKPLP